MLQSSARMDGFAKEQAHDFRDEAASGERLHLKGSAAADWAARAEQRYALEPCITDFARFGAAKGKDGLEIGVERHERPLLALARRLWPRRLIARLLPGHGLYLLIEGWKRS